MQEQPIPTGLNLTRDRVRWGPIIAGFLTAFTTLLVLGLLGLAVGLTTVDAGAVAAGGAPPADAGRNAGIWGAVSAVVAFLLGGYVAGRTSAIFSRGWGALNGVMVFLVAVPVILWLAGQGLGAIFGTLGAIAPALNVNPGDVQNAAQAAAGQAQQAAANVTPEDVARAVEAARTGAMGALVGVLLGLGASALGGALGTRRELDIDRSSGRLTD